MAKPDGMFLYIGTYPSEAELAPTTTSSRSCTHSTSSGPTTPL